MYLSWLTFSQTKIQTNYMISFYIVEFEVPKVEWIVENSTRKSRLIVDAYFLFLLTHILYIMLCDHCTAFYYYKLRTIYLDKLNALSSLRLTNFLVGKVIV